MSSVRKVFSSSASREVRAGCPWRGAGLACRAQGDAPREQPVTQHSCSLGQEAWSCPHSAQEMWSEGGWAEPRAFLMTVTEQGGLAHPVRREGPPRGPNCQKVPQVSLSPVCTGPSYVVQTAAQRAGLADGMAEPS